jgi:hypothetical protein
VLAPGLSDLFGRFRGTKTSQIWKLGECPGQHDNGMFEAVYMKMDLLFEHVIVFFARIFRLSGLC